MLIKIDKNICRICLKNVNENDGINIFKDNTIVQKFEEITKLKVELNDGLTETFCYSCLNNLHIASKFIQLSISSDLHMKKYIEKLNNRFQCVSKIPIHGQFNEEIDLLISEGVEVESFGNTNISQNKLFQELFDESFNSIDNFENPITTENFEPETKQCEEEDCHSLSSLDIFLQLPPAKKKKKEINSNISLSNEHDSGLVEIPSDNLSNLQKKFECVICHKQYASELYLKKHMKIHAKNDELFCKICQQYFPNEEMIVQHFAECDHENPFQCEICFEKFSQRRLLSLHAQNHLNEKLFHCNECDMKFNIMDQLTAHSKLVHKMAKVNVHKNFANFSSTLPTKNPYDCLKCEMKYPRADLLKKHIENFHDNVTCHICGNQVQIKLLNDHLEWHDKVTAVFKCGECDDHFNEKADLVKHFKLHNSLHKCDFCNKSFEKPMYLNKHLLECHQIQVSEAEVVELWLCNICNLPLVSRPALLDHQKSKHPSHFISS